MGKTSIFGRKSSKTFSEISPTNSQRSSEEKSKKSSRNQSFISNLGSSRKSTAKNDTPKVDRRKNKDKAKQLSENKNSLRRIKKHDAVKSIVQRLPSEVKSSRSSGTGGLYDSIHMGSSIYKTQGNFPNPDKYFILYLKRATLRNVCTNI